MIWYCVVLVFDLELCCIGVLWYDVVLYWCLMEWYCICVLWYGIVLY